MNKNREHGFTLIELLAVIVILAIIVLIATPIVLGIIGDANKSSMIRNADLYLDGVELAITNAILENKKVMDSTYAIMGDGNICLEYDNDKCTNILEVDVEGERPSSGKITTRGGQIKDFQITYKNKTIVQSNNELVFTYKENSNIEAPNLYNGTLTPVIYDGNNWIIADASSKWYNYSKQEWANAVILRNDANKKVGDTVTVDGENPEVLAMLVWIPRYEYKIEGTYGTHSNGTAGTQDLPGEIKVNFINAYQKEASEGYRIHSAFTFGDAEIGGIWVGKFEVSHANKTNGSMGCTTEQCIEANNIRILPNLQSLNKNTVSSFFYGIRSMCQDSNIFGINKSITDTHMIKNNEWGAVAYLSQSKYGKYGNSIYTGKTKEVYINNSSLFYTGRSGGSYGGNTVAKTIYESQTSEDLYVNYGYYTYDGYLLQFNTNNQTKERDMSKIASTTGNIYGVYDMSGGSWEYVMGVFANSYEELWSEKSGFKGKSGENGIDIEGLEWPEEKYYQVYKASSGITMDRTMACNGEICYGDALKETERWYNDSNFFVSSKDSWFLRGSAYWDANTTSGVFSSSGASGGDSLGYSTRVVFTPTT